MERAAMERIANKSLEDAVLQLIIDSGKPKEGLTLNHLHSVLRRMDHPECPSTSTASRKVGPQGELKELLMRMSSIRYYPYRGEAAFRINEGVKPTQKPKSEPSDTSDEDETFTKTPTTKARKATLRPRTAVVPRGSGAVKVPRGSVRHDLDPSRSKVVQPVKDELESLWATIDELVKSKRPRDVITIRTSTLEKLQEKCLDALLLLDKV